jgi:hypothetical protein
VPALLPLSQSQPSPLTTGTEVEAKVDTTTTTASARELTKGFIDKLATLRVFSACVLLNFSVLSVPWSNLFVTYPGFLSFK